MQTKRVIDTIKWLNELFPDAEKLIEIGRQPDDVSLVFLLANKLGRFAHAVEQNPDAVKVLTAFGLKDLLDTKLLGTPKRGAADRQLFLRLYRKWQEMTNCARPLDELTTPHIKLAEDEDEIDLNLLDRDDLSIDTLISVLVGLKSLYEAVAEATGEKKPRPLEILKIESGTNLGVNLKGLGSPIKEIKKLILEIWIEFRHRKADKIIGSNKAIASSLEIIVEIDKKKKRGALSGPDAERLKHAIIKRAFGLLEQGAFIAEIPSVETVNNAKLLENFGTKLLAPPVDGTQSENVDEAAGEAAGDSLEDEYSNESLSSFTESHDTESDRKKRTRRKHT